MKQEVIDDEEATGSKSVQSTPADVSGIEQKFTNILNREVDTRDRNNLSDNRADIKQHAVSQQRDVDVIFADAGSALSSAVCSIVKCEGLLLETGEGFEQILVAVMCKLREIKESLGFIIEDLTKTDSLYSIKKFDSVVIKEGDVDEFVVKTELIEEDSSDSLKFQDDFTDKDFVLPIVKLKKESNGSYSSHAKASGNFNLYKCDECDLVLTSKVKLRKHKKSHRQYMCGQCNTCFSSKKLFLKHTRETKHRNGTEIFCDKCNKPLLSEASYKSHVLQFHSKSHVCKMCEMAFDMLKELREHMKVEHNTVLKKFTCPTCNEVFNDVESLQQHSKDMNHGTGSTCELCGKVCASAGTLKVHMKYKHSQKFTCEDCGEVVGSKNELRSHRNTVHAPKEFICSTCGHTTQNKEAFRQHLKIHEDKEHACQFCNKLFTLKQTLKAHLRIHTGEKPLVCQVCGMRFRKSSGLSTHKIIHTGERPFVCNICGKGFTQGGNLKTHMKSHAAGTIPPIVKVGSP